MESFQIKTSLEPKFSLIFKLLSDDNLQIIATGSNQQCYKQVYSKLPQNLSEIFDTAKQLYEYLKTEKPQTINFVPQKVQLKNASFIGGNIDRIQFQVRAFKVLRKYLPLTFIKPLQSQYRQAMKQVNESEINQQIKKRINQKRQILKQLQKALNQVQGFIKLQQQQIQSGKENLSHIERTTIQKGEQISKIKKDYQKKYGGIVKIQSIKKGQGKSLISGSAICPTASTIFQAMPNPCEKHPLGKHIEFHNGKKTLFLKNKQINDSDIEGMNGFDWDQIQILSLGSNNLTNNCTQTLQEISEWPNVVQVYLFANKITDISALKFLSHVQLISLYDLQLNQASCNFLITTEFKELKELFLKFADNVNQKCWKKIVQNQFKNFPKLETLNIDNGQKLCPETRVSINKLCQLKKVKMVLGNPNNLQCQIY